MFRHQNVGRNHNVLVADKSCKNMAKFKCLGTTLIHQYCIQEEIKGRM
jgi:hypothetical protein